MTHAERKRAKRLIFLMTQVFRIKQLLTGKDNEETNNFEQWKKEMNQAIQNGESIL